MRGRRALANRHLVPRHCTYLRNRPAPAGGGSTYTIYPSAPGGVAPSGYITSVSTSDYASARAGSGLAASVDPSGLFVGQEYSQATHHDPQTWICWECFLDFDTSVVVGTISSATLSVAVQTNNGVSSAFSLLALLRDWGSTLTTADWVAGASLGGLTLLASKASDTLGSGSYVALNNSGNNLKNNINQSGVTRMMLASSNHRDGSEPFEDEYVVLYPGDHATLKPKLVVVTT